jgi:hypothetical protein
MTVDIESLSRPEHDDGEEICSRNESNDQSQCEDTRFLLEPGREHGMLCAVNLPETEGDYEEEANE